jgi:cytochrome-b5 reductase
MTESEVEYLTARTAILVGFLAVTCVTFFVSRVSPKNRRPGGISTLNHATGLKYEAKLIEKVNVTKNVRIFRFALPSNEHVVGLPIGKHVTLSAMIRNPLNASEAPRLISRQYTPVTSDYNTRGHFDLLIKVYPKNEHPQFPEGGWMSQHLDIMSIGDCIDVKGPNGRIEYMEKGRIRIGQNQLKVSQIAMIAGGTGITPMYQFIQHILLTRHGRDNTKLSLLYGNQKQSDILMRETLEELSLQHPGQFSLHMTVDRVEKTDSPWDGFVGYVSPDMISKSLPNPSSDMVVLLCGPPPMVRSVETHLLSLGYSRDRIYAF